MVAYELARPEVAVGFPRHHLANLYGLRPGPGASAPAKNAAFALILSTKDGPDSTSLHPP